MTSTDLVRPASAAGDERLEYRALSALAVASLVLGILGPLTILAAAHGSQAFMLLCPIPLIGLVVGMRSWRSIRRRPDELTGMRLAVAGILLSAVSLAGGLALAAYNYATEVPEGYARLSFAMLKPDVGARRRRTLVPADVLQLSGKKVSIRGYMRPSSQRYRLREFLLVRDNYQCCFGALDKVKYHDLVQVRLVGALRADFRTQSLRVSGTLHVDPDSVQPGAEQAVFALEADHIHW